MVQLMNDFANSVNSLDSVISQPYKQPSAWIAECVKLITDMEKITAKLNDSNTSNPLLNESLKNFGKTYTRQLSQFKFLCCAYGFGVEVTSYENVSFATILKDFSFLLSPITIRMKDLDKS